MRAPSSKFILEEDAVANPLTMDVVNEQELACLVCTGRVSPPVTCNDYNPYQPQYGRHPGQLDARLDHMDVREEEFVVRLDAWVNPEFWAECRIPLPQLQQWLLTQGIEMSYRVLDAQ